ncbi:MAG: hypothetical protein IPP38_05300 [Bacteroidetes bacterium]|nr:hypothetical protein [Bacteroidota bacterium]
MESPKTNPPQIKSRNVSTHDLVHAVSKLKWLILIISIGIGGFTFWYSKTRILTYSSSASFYINDINSVSLTTQNNETKPLDGLLTGESFNRVYQLILSSRTQNYLIRKFKLFEHYHIDSTKEFSFEKVANRLRNNIEIKKSPFNLVTVTVNDEYRYLAAEMANEIIYFVDKQNKIILSEGVQRKITIYNSLIQDIQKTNQTRKREIEALLSKMNAIVADLENRKQNTQTLLELQQKLTGMIVEMEASNTDLIKIQRYQTLALQLIKEKNLPSIMFMQYARPYSFSLIPKALLVSIGMMALFWTVFIILLYWKMKYSGYLSLLAKI